MYPEWGWGCPPVVPRRASVPPRQCTRTRPSSRYIVCVHLCMYVCMYVCMYIYIYIYICPACGRGS